MQSTMNDEEIQWEFKTCFNKGLKQEFVSIKQRHPDVRPDEDVCQEIGMDVMFTYDVEWFDILKNNFDIHLDDVTDHWTYPLVFFAATFGKGEVLDYLLSNGCDVNQVKDGRSLIGCACAEHMHKCESTHTPLTQDKVDRGYMYTPSGLVCHSMAHIIDILLRHGASIDKGTISNHRSDLDQPWLMHPWCRFTMWALMNDRATTCRLIRRMAKHEHDFRDFFESTQGWMMFQALMLVVAPRCDYEIARSFVLRDIFRERAYAFLLGRIRQPFIPLDEDTTQIIFDLVLTSVSRLL